MRATRSTSTGSRCATGCGSSRRSTCPKDASQRYPFLLTRTPYSVAPYGVDSYRNSLGPSEHFEQEGFIFVYQDARGRYMSEGEFQQVRPARARQARPARTSTRAPTPTTPSSGCLKNVAEPQRARRHVSASRSRASTSPRASIDSHPALKAASPQAPTADYYMGDDVYHNGAFMLARELRLLLRLRPARRRRPSRRSRRVALRPRHARRLRLLPRRRPARRRQPAALRRRGRATGRRSSTTRPTTTSGRGARCGAS